MAQQLDRAPPRQIAAIEPGLDPRHQAVVDQLPAGVAVATAGAHQEAARGQRVEHRAGPGDVGAGQLEQLGLGARGAGVGRRDQADEQLARDPRGVGVELGVEHPLEVLTDDGVEAAEPLVVRHGQRRGAGVELVVEHRARELEVRRIHRPDRTPAQLGADRGAGGLEIVEQAREQRRLDGDVVRGQRQDDRRLGAVAGQRRQAHDRHAGLQPGIERQEAPEEVLAHRQHHHRVGVGALEPEQLADQRRGAVVVGAVEHGLDLIDDHRDPRAAAAVPGLDRGRHGDLGPGVEATAHRRRGAVGAGRHVQRAQAERGQPRHQPGAQERRLAGARRRGVDQHATDRELLDQRRDVAIAAVQVIAIGLGERGQVAERRSRGRGDRDVTAGQRPGQLGGALVALGGIEGERARQHRAQLGVDDQRVERRHQLAEIDALPAGEQRDHHQPHREQIRARVDATVAELLGRHVRRRAAHRLGGLVGRPQARQAEVDQHQALADHDQVARLDVGVDQAEVVGRAQPGQELGDQRQRARPRQRTIAIDHLLQIVAVQELHREEQPTARRHVGLVDAHHVHVIDAADRLDLVDEQPAVLGVRIDVGVQHLHRDVAIDRELARAIHRAERAAGQQPIEAEPPGQLGPGEIVGVAARRRVETLRRE